MNLLINSKWDQLWAQCTDALTHTNVTVTARHSLWHYTASSSIMHSTTLGGYVYVYVCVYVYDSAVTYAH